MQRPPEHADDEQHQHGGQRNQQIEDVHRFSAFQTRMTG